MKPLLLTTIAAVVLVGCGPSTPDISIHDAALEGNIEAIKQHLAAGTDVNAKDDDGYTPLDYAVPAGKEETADLLRKHGGISGAEDSIHVAAIMGNIEAVRQHLAAGADVNAKNQNGSTPLHLAPASGHKEIAELLIARGADVNAKNKYGVTPLHFAAGYGRKETVELLIAEGADVNAQHDDGGTPLDWAIINKYTEIADLLRRHGGKTSEELKAEGK